jgi:hypothetical protein
VRVSSSAKKTLSLGERGPLIGFSIANVCQPENVLHTIETIPEHFKRMFFSNVNVGPR